MARLVEVYPELQGRPRIADARDLDGGLTVAAEETGVLKSLFDAHTILYATSDDIPIALTIAEQRVVGRLTGENITAITIGIADNNILQVDHASPADDDYAKFTAAGLEGRSYQELVNDISGVIKATDVEVSEIGTATYDDVQDFINNSISACYVTGGTITEHTDLDGTVVVAAAKGYIRTGATELSPLVSFDIAQNDKLSLADDGLNRINIDYNSGTPIFTATTAAPNHYSVMTIGRVWREATTNHLHIMQGGHAFQDFAFRMHQALIRTHGMLRATGLVSSESGSESLGVDKTSGVLYKGINDFTISAFDSGLNHVIDDFPANNQIQLNTSEGDKTSDYIHGNHLTVHGSTNNDGTYHVESAAWDSTNTTITIEEVTLSLDTEAAHVHYQTFDYWYYDGDLGTPAWVEVEGSVALSNSQYNAVATGLASLTANRYGVHWIYQDFDGDMHVVYGQGDWTLSQAEDDTPPATLPTLLNDMCMLVAKVIVKQGTSTWYGVVYPWEVTLGTSAATDHGGLAGLSGDDHPQYFLLAGETTDANLHSGADLNIYSDAGSTIKAQIDGATGHIGINQNADSQTGIDYEEQYTLADNSIRYGTHVKLKFHKTSAAFTNYNQGARSQIWVDDLNTQNWTHAIGLVGTWSRIVVQAGTPSSSTITGAAAYQASASILVGGSLASDMVLTNYYGLYVDPVSLVHSSKLTNDYGIYIGAQAGGATLNYAIYTAGGLVYHAGNVSLGGTLDVTGTVTIPTALTGVIRADSGVLSVDTDVTDIVSAASTTAAGIVELAIGSEVNTGTSTTLAVTPDALDDWTGSAQLATVGTVTSGTLSTGAVLADVTMTLGSDADGDIYYRSSNKLTRLAKGTAGHYLKQGASIPEWAAAGGAATQEFFTCVAGGTEFNIYGAKVGAYRIDAAADQAFVNFSVPDDFSSITEAVIVTMAANTGTFRLNFGASYGADGTSIITHQETLDDQDKNCTNAFVYEWDISGILSSLAVDDRVACWINGDGTNIPNLLVLGVRFKYS